MAVVIASTTRAPILDQRECHYRSLAMGAEGACAWTASPAEGACTWTASPAEGACT
ncbi:MAG TPA: hypothetical protein VFW25_01995 [Silvibacterium sp.]|nr:hypothetical protein [Silvibacterium sp.]